MSEMTYKQAIKILSETKVADLPYKGAGDCHKMYDIARRMAIQALKEKAATEAYEDSIKDSNLPEPVAKTGDTIYVLTVDAPNEIEITKIKSVKRVIVDGQETFRYRAPCVYDDWGGNTWTFYDKDFGVKFFIDASAATEARKQACASDESRIPCQIGDVIPFKVKTGYVIHYIVEKIKISDDGVIKIRCKHGGGGQPRSFLACEVRALIKNNGVFEKEPVFEIGQIVTPEDIKKSKKWRYVPNINHRDGSYVIYTHVDGQMKVVFDGPVAHGQQIIQPND